MMHKTINSKLVPGTSVVAGQLVTANMLSAPTKAYQVMHFITTGFDLACEISAILFHFVGRYRVKNAGALGEDLVTAFEDGDKIAVVYLPNIVKAMRSRRIEVLTDLGKLTGTTTDHYCLYRSLRCAANAIEFVKLINGLTVEIGQNLGRLYRPLRLLTAIDREVGRDTFLSDLMSLYDMYFDLSDSFLEDEYGRAVKQLFAARVSEMIGVLEKGV